MNSTYSVRIEWSARRVRFPLHTPNKNTAAAKAAKIFSFLVTNGWDATLAKYKQRSRRAKLEEGSASDTVGALIEANRKYSTAREQSLHTYFKAMRRIAAGVMEIEDGEKFQSRGECGTEEWRRRVDAVPLRDLTPDKIQLWKQQFLERASKSSRRQSVTTVNSLIRNAKALFSKKLRPFIEKEVALPKPLPFEGVPMEKPASPRYRSRIDARALIADAREDLMEQHPEPYKMLLLAAVCGLRVSEIDWLLWDAFDFRAGILSVVSTDHHQLKSDDSQGEIALSRDMMKVFETYGNSAVSEFVIESHGSIQRSSTARSYRCQRHIDVLKSWLKGAGIRAQKPIHELRKEIGSVIASEEGIFAASRYLRHSDIRITSAIYADQKKRVVPSVGQNLLALG